MKINTFLFVLFFSTIKIANSQNADSLLKLEKVFVLGEVIVTEKANSNILLNSEITKLNNIDIASAINVLPSVIMQVSGSRNEANVSIRGFDLRRVPIFIDGIPVYVPYDGYVDLSRFTTYDISKIEVFKGYSPIIFGNNTMGGAINLVSKKPENKLELSTEAGLFSGKGYNGGINIGSKLGKFYFQGNYSYLSQKFVPLSQKFDTTALQTIKELNNSLRLDEKYSFKIGFTPNNTDEYSIVYYNQHGEKGNPIYLGEDNTIKLRYWQWPYWNKESLYFISKTTFADKNFIKSRLFYDKFNNKLEAYDNNKYNSQDLNSSFTNIYNDYSYGASLELGTEIIRKNLLKLATHYKTDVHSEFNIGEPKREIIDNHISIGIEDIITISDKIKLIPGYSFNIQNAILAENYNSLTDLIYNMPTDKKNASNAQISIHYNTSEKLKINMDFSYKTRFATMKDRYSYKMGRAIPNPYLIPESSANYSVSADVFPVNFLSINPSVFYSKLYNVIQNVDNVELGKSQIQNVGTAEFLGGDIALSTQYFYNFKLMASYSYIQQKNLTNSEILFTDVPKNRVFLSLEYNYKNFVNPIISGEYDSERFSTSYGIISKEFFVINSSVKFNILKNFTLKTGINNIFDENYTICEGYPEAGRNFFVSLQFNFTK